MIKISKIPLNNVLNTPETIIQSKKSKIKTTINELIEVSTIQGLPNLFKTKRNGFRLMWILFLIACSILCAYFVINCVIDFLNYNYFTSIFSITEMPAPFPAISICSYDTKDFDLNILKIVFNSRRLENWKNHFSWFDDQMYGKCYTFNGGKNLTNHTIKISNSTSSGFFFGLWLELYVNGVKDFGQLIVYVHNQTNLPISLYNKGFYVSSGSSNYYVMKRIFEKKLPMPYNDCYKDVTLFPHDKTLIDFILKKNQTYSQIDCIDLCRTMHYIKNNNKCPNCTLNSYDEIIYAKCAFQKDEISKNCSLSAIERFQTEGPNKVCAEYCPLECDSVSYEIQQIFEDLPSSGNTTTFYHNDFNTYENVSKNYFALYFYYEDLKYTLITQQPKMQVFDLVSSMGGLFGLFLGMGLLSFIEIVHLCLEIIILLLEK